MQLSRRALLSSSLAIPLLASAGASTASANLSEGGSYGTDSQPPARIPQGFTLFATAPDAAAGPTKLSKSIQALATTNGKLIYGYGDYDANSGSITGNGTNLSAFDLKSKSQTVVVPKVGTEAFLSLRKYGNTVYAPVIDQTSGDTMFAYANGKSGGVVHGPSMEHTFDITIAGNTLIATGSGSVNGNPGSVAYAYNLARKTWNNTPVYSETQAGVSASDNDWRYYWTRNIGPEVFFQRSFGNTSHLIRYNVVSKKSALLPNISVVTDQEECVENYGQLIFIGNGPNLVGFDWQGKERIHKAFTGDDEYIFSVKYRNGALYVTTTCGIYRTYNARNWTKVYTGSLEYSSNHEAGWFCTEITNRHVFMGGEDGRILVSNFTV